MRFVGGVQNSRRGATVFILLTVHHFVDWRQYCKHHVYFVVYVGVSIAIILLHAALYTVEDDQAELFGMTMETV